jgi:hypothetical protein
MNSDETCDLYTIFLLDWGLGEVVLLTFGRKAHVPVIMPFDWDDEG